MSVNINALASEFGCTEEDIKSMITPFAQESGDHFEVIKMCVDGGDFEHVTMSTEVIKSGAKDLHITSVIEICDKLLAASSAGDQAACSTELAALDTELQLVKSLV